MVTIDGWWRIPKQPVWLQYVVSEHVPWSEQLFQTRLQDPSFPTPGLFLLPFPHQPPINSLFKGCVGSLSCFPASIVQSLP